MSSLPEKLDLSDIPDSDRATLHTLFAELASYKDQIAALEDLESEAKGKAVALAAKYSLAISSPLGTLSWQDGKKSLSKEKLLAYVTTDVLEACTTEGAPFWQFRRAREKK